jgi:hypothetical protein
LAGDIAIQYRKYPQLLTEFAELSSEIGEQHSEIWELRGALVTEYQRGVSDGASRMTGVALGADLGSLPKITALTSFEGQPTLVATYGPDAWPALDTWLQVEVVGTGDVKGAVVVAKINADKDVVLLRCCERTVPEYWSRLEARMDEDPESPKGVRQRHYVHDQSDPHPVVADEKEGTQAWAMLAMDVGGAVCSKRRRVAHVLRAGLGVVLVPALQ